MTKDELVLNYRLGIVYFKHAWKYKNTTSTCRLFNLS